MSVDQNFTLPQSSVPGFEVVLCFSSFHVWAIPLMLHSAKRNNHGGLSCQVLVEETKNQDPDASGSMTLLHTGVPILLQGQEHN